MGVAIPEFRHTPAVRMENACATGSAAIWSALDALAAGRFKRVLVLGIEKMNTLPNKEIGEILLKASFVQEEGHTEGGFAGVFGQIASGYFERFGDQSDALAAISAKNHSNGVHNPYAHMRRDLGFDFCRNPSEKKSFCCRPLKTLRLLARLRRCGSLGAFKRASARRQGTRCALALTYTRQ